MSDSVRELENTMKDFDNRYRAKKIANMICSIIIIFMGVFSVIYTYEFDNDGIMTFRWMTVDGTIYTTILTIIVVACNVYELIRKTEVSRKVVYLLRLSSAVTEGIIIIVVLISQLPFFPTHMHIARIDMFFMHICIPILTILSFINNDSPIRKLSLLELSFGTSFVIIYLIIIVTMIGTGVLTKEYIPYDFLNFENMGGKFAMIGLFVLAYIGSGVLAHFMSVWNRKAYWFWFKNVAKRGEDYE